MKKHTLFIPLLILFLFPLIITSQKNSHNQQRSNQNSNQVESIEKQMVKIQEKLGLDGLQAVLIERVLQKYAIKKKELRKQLENRQVMMAKMQNLNLERDNELSELLTEEQMVELKKVFKEASSQKKPQAKKGSGQGSGKGKGRGRKSMTY